VDKVLGLQVGEGGGELVAVEHQGGQIQPRLVRLQVRPAYVRTSQGVKNKGSTHIGGVQGVPKYTGGGLKGEHQDIGGVVKGVPEYEWGGMQGVRKQGRGAR